MRRRGIAADRGGQKLKPQITRTDLRTGKVEVLAENYQGKPFVGPNDVTIDGEVDCKFTDLTGGAVYRIDGPGQLARILAAPDIQRPNGIQISPDDKQLYLIEANGAEGGARMIRAAICTPTAPLGTCGSTTTLSGPKRGRDEHRYAGQPVRLRRNEPASRNL
jgi:hypothetical protein